MFVYLYTRYKDLGDLKTGNLVKQMEYQLLHSKRDGIFLNWLLKNNIGSFPKKISEFNDLKSKFEEFTKKTSDQLVLFFVHKKHHEAHDELCMTLHQGEWQSFPDMKIAVAESFHLAKGTIVINQYEKVFENMTTITIDEV